MRILGIDFGDRRIGLAVSDKLGFTAQALDSYCSRGRKKDGEYFKKLVSEYEISEVVVGLPLRMNGSLGTRAEKTQEFADWLKKILDLPVALWDERLTTKQAFQILNQQKLDYKAKKNQKDKISAVIILSTYLERKRVKSHAG